MRCGTPGPVDRAKPLRMRDNASLGRTGENDQTRIPKRDSTFRGIRMFFEPRGQGVRH